MPRSRARPSRGRARSTRWVVVNSERPRPRAAGPSILLSLLFAFIGGAPAHAELAGRLIDIIDATRRDDHANINVQFSCTMRYISHLPATAGTETQIRFRPGTDCRLRGGFSGVGGLSLIHGA